MHCLSTFIHLFGQVKYGEFSVHKILFLHYGLIQGPNIILRSLGVNILWCGQAGSDALKNLLALATALQCSFNAARLADMVRSKSAGHFGCQQSLWDQASGQCCSFITVYKPQAIRLALARPARPIKEQRIRPLYFFCFECRPTREVVIMPSSLLQSRDMIPASKPAEIACVALIWQRTKYLKKMRHGGGALHCLSTTRCVSSE